MERVLVGVDGSDHARRALRWASEWARCRDAVLQVVLVPAGSFWIGKDWSSITKVVEEAKAVLDSVVDDVVGDDPSVEVERRVEYGRDPRRVLTDLSTDADLLVVGARGHGEIAGLLLGSVSQHLVSHAQCPVTVVRAND